MSSTAWTLHQQSLGPMRLAVMFTRSIVALPDIATTYGLMEQVPQALANGPLPKSAARVKRHGGEALSAKPTRRDSKGGVAYPTPRSLEETTQTR